jgi:hypothetical protein
VNIIEPQGFFFGWLDTWCVVCDFDLGFSSERSILGGSNGATEMERSGFGDPWSFVAFFLHVEYF